MRHASDDPEILRGKIALDTARIPWRSLQRHFAGGRVLRVADDLDLVTVALAVATDDTAAIRNWTDAGRLDAVDDARAAVWHADDAAVWAVVVAPWVLVQAQRPNEST